MCVVPGPPVSLNAVPSQADCTSVQLSWSPPIAIGTIIIANIVQSSIVLIESAVIN